MEYIVGNNRSIHKFLQTCTDVHVFNALYKAKRNYFINHQLLAYAVRSGSIEIVKTLAEQTFPIRFQRTRHSYTPNIKEYKYSDLLLQEAWVCRQYSMYFYLLNNVKDEDGEPLCDKSLFQNTKAVMIGRVNSLLIKDIKMFSAVRQMAHPEFANIMVEWAAANPEILYMTDDTELIDRLVPANLLPKLKSNHDWTQHYHAVVDSSGYHFTYTTFESLIKACIDLDLAPMEPLIQSKYAESRRRCITYGVPECDLGPVEMDINTPTYLDIVILEQLAINNLRVDVYSSTMVRIIKTGTLVLIPYILEYIQRGRTDGSSMHDQFYTLVRFGEMSQLKLAIKHLEARAKIDTIVVYRLLQSLINSPHEVVELIVHTFQKPIRASNDFRFTTINPNQLMLSDAVFELGHSLKIFKTTYISDHNTIKYLLKNPTGRHDCLLGEWAARFGCLDVLRLTPKTSDSNNHNMQHAIVGGHPSSIGFMLERRKFLMRQDTELIAKLNNIKTYDLIVDKLGLKPSKIEELFFEPETLKTFFIHGSDELLRHILRKHGLKLPKLEPSFVHYGHVSILKMCIGQFINNLEPINVAIVNNRVEVFDLLFNKLRQMDEFFEESKSMFCSDVLDNVFKEKLEQLIKSNCYAMILRAVLLGAYMDLVVFTPQLKFKYPTNVTIQCLGKMYLKKKKELRKAKQFQNIAQDQAQVLLKDLTINQ
ncbi:hypothetical protein SAMD00019534_091860 [Acytostelium subglobosum LB1]|uniref:hypothetical protein n=1 Tax=Acytostelium subglobosum LB1 TaxID=1410327 RepID=UPI000644974E|nr:hypothetical protein SAMD00019534_091860 [Acytostelium subglobosum LB1]GAM26011.1 hypothetical protein SAMD00019534_091860 [Acytostelium subglobosum LB1]|eukprot:XP_012751054.1 hypothetical protein SAMD00019534_091860 [Acytostelium subglobosum LB1]